MKVVFMGTPDFAVPVLERLIAEHNVVCVYTRAPKEAGRGQKECKTPVHSVAEKHGIEVRTPKTLRNDVEQAAFKALNADVAVVAAYGLILPLPILQAYPWGCLNVHASLLPRWRGAAPIQRCIEAGDKVSGVTVMQMAEGLDTGDMLLKGEVAITPATTGGELHDKLSLLGADLMSQTLAHIADIKPEKQDDSLTCYAAKIEKAESKLDFNQSAEILARKIRAFYPYPATYFEHNNERFKVLAAEVIPDLNVPAGTIIADTKTLKIACRQGALQVTKIQRQGKKVMGVEEMLRGFGAVKFV